MVRTPQLVGTPADTLATMTQGNKDLAAALMGEIEATTGRVPNKAHRRAVACAFRVFGDEHGARAIVAHARPAIQAPSTGMTVIDADLNIERSHKLFFDHPNREQRFQQYMMEDGVRLSLRRLEAYKQQHLVSCGLYYDEDSPDGFERLESGEMGCDADRPPVICHTDDIEPADSPDGDYRGTIVDSRTKAKHRFIQLYWNAVEAFGWVGQWTRALLVLKEFSQFLGKVGLPGVLRGHGAGSWSDGVDLGADCFFLAFRSCIGRDCSANDCARVAGASADDPQWLKDVEAAVEGTTEGWERAMVLLEILDSEIGMTPTSQMVDLAMAQCVEAGEADRTLDMFHEMDERFLAFNGGTRQRHGHRHIPRHPIMGTMGVGLVHLGAPTLRSYDLAFRACAQLVTNEESGHVRRIKASARLVELVTELAESGLLLRTDSLSVAQRACLAAKDTKALAVITEIIARAQKEQSTLEGISRRRGMETAAEHITEIGRRM